LKLTVIAVGHRMPAWVTAGFEEYAKRMPRDMPLVLTELKPEARRDEPGSAAAQRVLDKEADRIEAALDKAGKGVCRVVLDEAGKTVATAELARRLRVWRDGGRDVAFVIGGADGTAPRLKTGAAWLWSLSPLTLPHGLVRVVLAEQLYRAQSILANHPYHRA
jgi:23S rRNA (pseudouridine1915-N3)-methyltransferase